MREPYLNKGQQRKGRQEPSDWSDDGGNPEVEGDNDGGGDDEDSQRNGWDGH